MSKATAVVAPLSPLAKARSTRSLRIKAARRKDNSRPQTTAGVGVYRILLALDMYMIRTKYASEGCKRQSRQHNRHAISYQVPGIIYTTYRIAVSHIPPDTGRYMSYIT